MSYLRVKQRLSIVNILQVVEVIGFGSITIVDRSSEILCEKSVRAEARKRFREI